MIFGWFDISFTVITVFVLMIILLRNPTKNQLRISLDINILILLILLWYRLAVLII